MKIDTEGTYTLRYTAEDECGNVTTEDRTVNAINITYSTVLFADGHFIINEKSTDRDANIALHGAVTREFDPLNPNGSTDASKYIFSNALQVPWYNNRSSIKRAEIGSPISPQSMAYWFMNHTAIESIDTTNLDTSLTTNMEHTFDNCSVLTTLDVSSFDTSNVTKMNRMFYSCQALDTIDVSAFDTSKVTDMSDMFAMCRAVTLLDVSSFNTSNVTAMNGMFNMCTALATPLDVSSFDTSKVVNMSYMFQYYPLNALDVSSFNTSNVTMMDYMFSSCSALRSIDLTSFNTSIVRTAIGMFAYSVFRTIDLSSFDTSALADATQMFDGCRQLTTIYASALFVTTTMANSTYMFRNATRLVGGAGTTWASNKPTDKTYAHIDGGTSNPGYFTAKS